MMGVEYQIVIRLFVAMILGGIIGWERERRRKYAGLRTHMLVCLGSALITVAGIYGFAGAGSDPSRLAAGIITGIGFLGGGAIFASRGEVHGLTTAASIWLAAAIGLATGTGMFIAAVASTIFAIIILELWIIEPEKEKKKED